MGWLNVLEGRDNFTGIFQRDHVGHKAIYVFSIFVWRSVILKLASSTKVPQPEEDLPLKPQGTRFKLA